MVVNPVNQLVSRELSVHKGVNIVIHSNIIEINLNLTNHTLSFFLAHQLTTYFEYSFKQVIEGGMMNFDWSIKNSLIF